MQLLKHPRNQAQNWTMTTPLNFVSVEITTEYVQDLVEIEEATEKAEINILATLTSSSMKSTDKAQARIKFRIKEMKMNIIFKPSLLL